MGTLTITTTAQQDQRLIAAYGRLLGTSDQDGNPRNATGAEIKAAVLQQMRDVVITFEQRRAIEAATIEPFTPT